MRYQIFSLQQEALVELNLNVEEALLLDWILNWKDGTGMKREFIEEQQDIGYWVNYETVVKELPILFKQPTSDMDEKALKKLLRNNKDKVGRMLKGNLSKVLTPHKMVYKGDKNKLGSMVFVVINREVIDILKNSNKKASTCDEVEAVEELDLNISSDIKNSNNIIPQNKRKENSKSLETNEVDYEQLALERCRLEIQGFDDMPQFRKDVNIGIMLQRIARGE